MITKETAIKNSMFFHVTLRNRDGSAVRARSSGACKTWKTRPDEFKQPVKHGLRDSFYITLQNAHEWLTYDPTEAIDKVSLDLCGK